VTWPIAESRQENLEKIGLRFRLEITYEVCTLLVDNCISFTACCNTSHYYQSNLEGIKLQSFEATSWSFSTFEQSIYHLLCSIYQLNLTLPTHGHQSILYGNRRRSTSPTRFISSFDGIALHCSWTLFACLRSCWELTFDVGIFLGVELILDYLES
jgi:hypothetical protein